MLLGSLLGSLLVEPLLLGSLLPSWLESMELLLSLSSVCGLTSESRHVPDMRGRVKCVNGRGRVCHHAEMRGSVANFERFQTEGCAVASSSPNHDRCLLTKGSCEFCV